MDDVRYDPNHEGFDALGRSPLVEAAVLAEAERAKAIAEGLAAEFTQSGTYERSFEVRAVQERVRTGFRTSVRAGGRLVNTAAYASKVELGDADGQAAHHVLRRTLSAL